MPAAAPIPGSPLSQEMGEGGRGGEGAASPLDVLSVGNFCVDLLVKPVRRLPEPGGLEIIDEYELQTGGCGNNCAIALSRLGLSVATVGRVGDDRTGDIVLELLTANGVRTDLMVRDRTARTSLSVVAVSDRGERSFLHHPGATLNLTAADVPAEALSGARALHVGGTFLLPGLDGAPMADLLRRARTAGALTFVDTAVDGHGNRLEVVEPILPQVDFFLPSEAEARGITGQDDPAAMAAFLLGRGVKAVCIKLGEQGCYVAGRSPHPLAPSPIPMGEGGPEGVEGSYVPAFSVVPVDTCGAGDTFTAGFIAGVLNGFDLAEAARMANGVGAMCVTGLGATTAVGSWDQTLAFMAGTPTRAV